MLYMGLAWYTRCYYLSAVDERHKGLTKETEQQLNSDNQVIKTSLARKDVSTQTAATIKASMSTPETTTEM